MVCTVYTSIQHALQRGRSVSALLSSVRGLPLISLANDYYSHLCLKVDIRLCYEQTIHDFTMVLLTRDVEGICAILEVRNGIAHEVYMQMYLASFSGLPHLQLLIASSIFVYWKRSKAGGMEGLGMRLDVPGQLVPATT